MMWFTKAPIKDPTPNLSRRGFIFGAAATSLIVAAPKSFFIIEPPKLIAKVGPPGLFDLPLQQMLALMKKLDENEIKPDAIPRWVWIDKAQYDLMVGVARA